MFRRDRCGSDDRRRVRRHRGRLRRRRCRPRRRWRRRQFDVDQSGRLVERERFARRRQNVGRDGRRHEHRDHDDHVNSDRDHDDRRSARTNGRWADRDVAETDRAPCRHLQSAAVRSQESERRDTSDVRRSSTFRLQTSIVRWTPRLDRRFLRALRNTSRHHPRGELAGVRVLPARVIAADQRLAVRQVVDRSVRELRPRPHDDASQLRAAAGTRRMRSCRARRRRARAAARRFRRRDAAGNCAISSGVGLLSGGAQRTAAAMNASRSSSPSSRIAATSGCSRSRRGAAPPSGSRPSRRRRRR